MENRLRGTYLSKFIKRDGLHCGATEYLTKWAEAKAVKTDTTVHAATFMYENIILRFGHPKILVSDRGSHFLNELFEEITVKFRINHRKTMPYHPQTNDQT